MTRFRRRPPVAYYNEFDPRLAAWLRNLIQAELIAKGEVDERSITDVSGDDLAGYRQCHFFAGIGGWSYALRLAEWPDDRPVWTGSCPCQPYSVAGKQKGKEDSRNLWPAFCRLIALRRPERVFGEQVSGAVGFGWLDRVRADLEAEAYAIGAVVLGAHSAGAPHIRQRLFWVANAGCGGKTGRSAVESRSSSQAETTGAHAQPGRCGLHGRLADAEHAERWPEYEEHGDSHRRNGSGRSGVSGELGDAAERTFDQESAPGVKSQVEAGGSDLPGFWGRYELLPCLDGKTRRTQPGLFPLAHGVPARMGRLRGYGNAIVPQAAAEFVRAFMELELLG